MLEATPKTARRAVSEDGRRLGALLVAARKQLGLTQTQAARRLGMPNSHLSHIERGADLRVSTLLDIARLLKLEPMLVPKSQVPSVRALLGDSAEPNETLERGRFA
ncbi:MAG: helix-turn-helix transcriptional regulator [Candidatus Baltobacteraceae bacterium]